MATIKFRVEINRGRIGVPLRKASLVYEKLHKFLTSAIKDLAIEIDGDQWIAKEFGNGSLVYTIENEAPVGDRQKRTFDMEFARLIYLDAEKEKVNGKFSKGTVLDYSKIGEVIDPDELIRFGFFNKKEEIDSWKELTKHKCSGLASALTVRREYVGAVFGQIHALNKTNSYVTLQQADTGDLVKCFYQDSMYGNVVKALEDKDAYVHFGGLVGANLITGKVENVRAEMLRTMRKFSGEQMRGFLGSVPNLTSGFSTDEFVGQFRDD